MGGILCKCFGGGEEPAQTLSSATDVREPLVSSAHKGFREELAETSSSAMDVTQSFVYKVTPKRFSLDHDTLGNTDDTLSNTNELKLELSKNPQLNSIIVEYLETSFYTDDFFSSIDKCLKEALSSANLLFEAVNSFENKTPTALVLESLRKFTVHDNTFPQIVIHSFKRQLENQFSRIQKLSERVKDLGQKLGKVSCWKVVCSGVYCVATVGWSIGSAVLVIMSNRQMTMKDFDQGHKGFERLDSEINVLLDEFKSSLKGKRDTTVDLLMETIEKLNRIRALMQQTSRAIEELNDIKARVHEHVEVYIKSVENAGFGMEWGNDEEVNRYMEKAMHGIKAEAERFKTIVENLKEEVNQCRDDLRTAVATILKAVEQNKNEFVCCCCCCCC